MTGPLEDLAPDVRAACERLRDAIVGRVGEDLVALWAYGAATRPDRPARPGDVDTHGVLARPPGPELAAAIDAAHEAIERDLGIEWDSWYVLEADARGSAPPRHALRPALVDGSWALHRAHWRAGEYVGLHGVPPEEIVRAPTWPELVRGLDAELAWVERIVAAGRDDPGHAAFSIANGCRILCSLERRDVVVSKRAAARWGLERLPGGWHAPLEAAMRVYDAAEGPGDAAVLARSLGALVAAVRERLGPGAPA